MTEMIATTTMNDKTIETHPLAPFLPSNGKALMMGSFPPPMKRWSDDFYYPNFTNDMWRIMGVLFFQDKDYFMDVAGKRILMDKIIAFLNEIGFALNDTVYRAHRAQGNAADKFLEVVEERDIRGLLDALPDCQIMITTGEKATGIACSQFGVEVAPKVGDYVTVEYGTRVLRLYRMPSSSRAYPMKLENKAAIYKMALETVFTLA